MLSARKRTAECGDCEGQGSFLGCSAHDDECDGAQPDCETGRMDCGSCGGSGEVSALLFIYGELMGLIGTMAPGESGEQLAQRMATALQALKEEAEADAAELEATKTSPIRLDVNQQRGVGL